jgi:hypothetical protein
MLRTEMPITPGRNSAMRFWSAGIASLSDIKSSRTVSWPARRQAAATNAGPSGKGMMAVLSVFAETRRTLMA